MHFVHCNSIWHSIIKKKRLRVHVHGYLIKPIFKYWRKKKYIKKFHNQIGSVKLKLRTSWNCNTHSYLIGIKIAVTVYSNFCFLFSGARAIYFTTCRPLEVTSLPFCWGRDRRQIETLGENSCPKQQYPPLNSRPPDSPTDCFPKFNTQYRN